MSRYKKSGNKPQQNPQRAKEAADPDPDMTAQVPREPKEDQSSRLEPSNEPAEDDEKRENIEKLKEREQDS